MIITVIITMIITVAVNYDDDLISCAEDVVDDLACIRLEVTSCKFLTRGKFFFSKIFLMTKISDI